MKRILIALALSITALLAGCAAPSVVSSVTVFHSMTGNETNKTYMVEASPEQANNLEFNSYVTMLNQELQRLGFTMVTKDPNLKVSLKYGTSQTVASSQEPVPAYGPYGYRLGAYPAWQTSVDTYYMQQMEVSINQTKDGKNIYSVRTRLLSASPELSQSMDYLMQSAFQNFPGKNGLTETVTLPAHQQ
ncbi:hypothetical protein AAKU67_003497 [Oxalobacteraceae bacterium GrIS 2.11]